MGTTIYLMRHGETEENKARILQGHLPGKLTPEGIRQAEGAGAKLAGMAIDAIVASDLKRCVDTAEIINRNLHLNIVYTKLLRERDWGSVTGVATDENHKITVPADAESVKAIKARASIFMDYIRKTYPGQTVLVVTHGFFCRCLRAVHGGVDISGVERMENADIVRLEL
ncbi:MAG: histidine phosphatase family protein [Bacteroides sp.]|nr:histidine phosphatase family protein [Roseburia sp.]MCM1347553.1 histidine phosphatase family protein [Bacteroides sp.]MCM1420605.1 histidine phosphatase family protein [Bacteroides sp.]